MCKLDEQITALRHEIFEIQDAKSRMVMEFSKLMLYYRLKRERARRRAEGE